MEIALYAQSASAAARSVGHCESANFYELSKRVGLRFNRVPSFSISANHFAGFVKMVELSRKLSMASIFYRMYAALTDRNCIRLHQNLGGFHCWQGEMNIVLFVS